MLLLTHIFLFKICINKYFIYSYDLIYIMYHLYGLVTITIGLWMLFKTI
mgnify:CR=1